MPLVVCMGIKRLLAVSLQSFPRSGSRIRIEPVARLASSQNCILPGFLTSVIPGHVSQSKKIMSFGLALSGVSIVTLFFLQSQSPHSLSKGSSSYCKYSTVDILSNNQFKLLSITRDYRIFYSTNDITLKTFLRFGDDF